ncbi:MAG: hypothetical protein NTV51_12610 [Verrucomicrobia bacterium]|nr:hypothetical protein [Verrucomicrobiota bacterium]
MAALRGVAVRRGRGPDRTPVGAIGQPRCSLVSTVFDFKNLSADVQALQKCEFVRIPINRAKSDLASSCFDVVKKLHGSRIISAIVTIVRMSPLASLTLNRFSIPQINSKSRSESN